MEIDLNSKCRVCLGESEEMHYLYEEIDQKITLQYILIDTTGCQVDKTDGLSPFLCKNCTNILIDFYNLKIVFKENDQQIRTLLAEEEKNEEEIEPIGETHEISENDMKKADDYITIKVETADSSDIEEIESVKEEEMETNQDGNVKYEYQELQTYTCPTCEECFLYKNDIQEHLISQHNITEANIDELGQLSIVEMKKSDSKPALAKSCKICHHHFQTEETYLKHLEIHKKNICDICGLGFIKKSYLRDHQETHSTERNHICNFCNKAFKRRTVLVKHRRIHTNPRESICEICGKAFNDKGTLKTHIKLLHMKARDYMCVICGDKFPLKATLEKHLKRHENRERQFFCSQCPLGYRDKSSLDRHIFVKHSGQNIKSTCSGCGKQYATISSLLKHQRIHHNANVKLEDQE